MSDFYSLFNIYISLSNYVQTNYGDDKADEFYKLYASIASVEVDPNDWSTGERELINWVAAL